MQLTDRTFVDTTHIHPPLPGHATRVAACFALVFVARRLQQKCRLTPGVPVTPMLAKPSKTIAEVLQRLSGQEFTCEYK